MPTTVEVERRFKRQFENSRVQVDDSLRSVVRGRRRVQRQVIFEPVHQASAVGGESIQDCSNASEDKIQRFDFTGELGRRSADSGNQEAGTNAIKLFCHGRKLCLDGIDF